MKLPHDLSASDLVLALAVHGYTVTRQTGSHLRLTSRENGVHQLTFPDHDSLCINTLAAILRNIADHADVTRDELAEELFGRHP